MRTYWERLGVLGPIYDLVGDGLTTPQIAAQLHVTEANVQSCTSWMLHFLGQHDREELVAYAGGTTTTARKTDPREVSL